MLRGILVSALLVAAAPAVPVHAAPSPYVFYEAVRLRPGGASQVPFRVLFTGAGLHTEMELEPADDGGYQRVSLSFGNHGSGGNTLWLVHPKAGHRYVYGGTRGSFSIVRLSYWFTFRPVAMDLRTVTPKQSDEDAYDVAGTHPIVFRSATAKGGAYGSAAIAWVPCGLGAGRWTFGTDAEPGSAQLCTNSTSSVLRETYRGRRWTMAGTVVGTSSAPYRLLVVDYPKR
jgi:hypothetical protein